MRLLILLGFALVLTAPVAAAPAEPKKAAAATTPVLVPVPVLALATIPVSLPDATAPFRSAFVNDSSSGKDPFFPRSVRRPLVRTGPASAVVFQDFPEDIQLKGIATQRGRKLALLNQYSFAEGEQGEIKVAGVLVRVQCVSIKERSVIVSVRGIRKELQLREGL